MEKKVITSNKAPKALGAYSQIICYGNQIYSAGQIGIDPETNKLVAGGVETQAKRALENVALLLEASNSSFEKVLKVTLYLTDMEHFTKVNEIYKSYFKPPFPARSAVAVKSLPLGALIELDFIAYTH
jgi:2-iminobutanoate/2-iminopropanoate deaminase